MSQGCPVVAFDCDYGPREIIRNHYNGLLVKNKDIKSLRNRIIYLLSNNQLRKKIVRNAVIRSLEFDSSVLSNQWIRS